MLQNTCDTCNNQILSNKSIYKAYDHTFCCIACRYIYINSIQISNETAKSNNYKPLTKTLSTHCIDIKDPNNSINSTVTNTNSNHTYSTDTYSNDTYSNDTYSNDTYSNENTPYYQDQYWKIPKNISICSYMYFATSLFSIYEFGLYGFTLFK